MKLTVGQTLVSTVDTTAMIVVRCPEEELTVTCGGREMVPQGAAPAAAPGTGTAEGGGAQLGKRYTVEGVAVELLCVKPGTHPVAVDGVPVSVKAAKPLPASD
ncbi:hypothetical protein HNP84_007109 [Thermocatellispora tengchongensis]|uniref:Uncharacterized protein n=1 Tax=Thermocatellispora tengchongensis TaxID=1073253 RepID=A0A840PJV3_9ACTN|nr:hypothetical protein [Thermocatellispora tengchongensis]MBB5137357.1 hypothetical protein [Thermocatellispora tengchongensis]